MKKLIGLFGVILIFGFTPIEKSTASLIGIWINPTNDVKIKIEEVKGQTRAVLFWTTKPEAKEHVGRIVIKQIEPQGNNFKAMVIAPERRKYVNGIIEIKNQNTLLITGYDAGKSVSNVYRKVKDL